MDRDGGGIFKKILFRRKNYLCPEIYPRLYPDMSETFHEAWERLRDLNKECPHHGVSNHELT